MQVISALVCKCLGLGHGRLNQFRFSAGSISVIEFPSPDDLERITVRLDLLGQHRAAARRPLLGST